MRHRLVLASAIALAFAAASTVADARPRHAHGHADYDWAQVVDVAPIIRFSDRPVYREQCWQEPVRERVVYEDHRRRQGGAAARVTGTIVGGVIGNQFGDGRGRTAMTVAGAALGNAIVRDSQAGGGTRYVDERTVYADRCETVAEYVRDERVEGYDVTYRYNGRTYQTRTDHHPGDRIQVRVDVTPVR